MIRIRYLLSLVVSSILFGGCFEDTSPSQDIDILIIPFDTLNFTVNSPSFELSVLGASIDEIELETANQGAFAGVSQTSTDFDTTATFSVDRSTVVWSTSNSSVVGVSNGVLSFNGEGSVLITATFANVVSNSVFVDVTPDIPDPPELTLDPPQRVLIFSDSGIVSGQVTVGAVLSIDNNVANYDDEGIFEELLTGLPQAETEVLVVASELTDETINTTESKFFIYQTPDANSTIVGRWQGTVQGRNFEFDVSYNADNVRFDITGTISIEVLGVGLIEDIRIDGIIDGTGRINAPSEFSEGGIELMSLFSGFFSDDGTAVGSFDGSVSASGISQSIGIPWTAVKLD